MSSSFEEAEFGGRKVVPAGKPGKPGKIGKTGKDGKDGKTGKTGKTGRKRTKSHSGKKPKAGGRKQEKNSSKRQDRVDSSGSGVLVPLDQWTRVLNQLGNLHEAGQQIAEARERAARAETEAAFLRERLRELRAELEVHKRTQGV
jgi:hypothetical protein